MPLRIEDYAIIGDCHTAALVGNNGSVDWLSFPRFDSAACMASLLGNGEHGHWRIYPEGRVLAVRRSYREGTLVLETDFRTVSGEVTLIDFMPLRTKAADLVRIVAGRSGKVPMKMRLTMRFDYGQTVPWVRRIEGGIHAVAGPHSLRLLSGVPVQGEGFSTVAEFTVAAEQRIPFTLTWYPTYGREPPRINPEKALIETDRWWRDWSAAASAVKEFTEPVCRSLITLKALTYAPTGGIAAAATTSLPERIGGVRNWDYRYCWLRDATFTLYALLFAGYREEAQAWREWLVRTVAGDPSKIRIMYGLAGERLIAEQEIPWLDGYENSRPVRVGNAAFNQHQLDVYGEVMDALHHTRLAGLHPDENAWRVQRALLDFLESDWEKPDEGIWEVRGPRRNFTHSKIMAWVAVDRAIKGVEQFSLDGPVERWRHLRRRIFDEVCSRGYHADLGAFVQSFESREPDASLLMIPLVGFLPATDPRVRGTVDYIERTLLHDGLLLRYRSETGVDNLPAGEGTFLACSFWLADNYELLGRHEDALILFERLLSLRNDVGLLAEEYDPRERRMLGNFPQAFSHVGLINTARHLSRAKDAAEDPGGS